MQLREEALTLAENSDMGGRGEGEGGREGEGGQIFEHVHSHSSKTRAEALAQIADGDGDERGKGEREGEGGEGHVADEVHFSYLRGLPDTLARTIHEMWDAWETKAYVSNEGGGAEQTEKGVERCGEEGGGGGGPGKRGEEGRGGG